MRLFKYREKTPLPLLLLAGWLVTFMLWWAFAFAPVPSSSPEWVERARDVCFGRMENGLPEPFGWILLIGAPLMMLGGILVIWGHELKGLSRWLRHHRSVRRFGILLAALLISEIGWVGVRIAQAVQIPVNAEDFAATEEEFPDTYPRLDRAAPDFNLVDQKGGSVRLKDFQGRLVYLSFAFAHCQTVCPTIVHSLKQAATKLHPEPVLLIVTLDPWRDTPSSLPTLARKWELPEGAHVLSGPVPDVLKVLEDYEIPRSRDEGTGDITHPALTYVIGPDGKIAYRLNNASGRMLAGAGRRALK